MAAAGRQPRSQRWGLALWVELTGPPFAQLELELRVRFRLSDGASPTAAWRTPVAEGLSETQRV